MRFLKLHKHVVSTTNKGKRSSSLNFPGKKCSRCSQLNQRVQRKKAMKKIGQSMEKLKEEMEEISEDQKSIREGQRQVRERFEQMEKECKQLRQETKQITIQSKTTQLRLALIFQILKARKNNDFARATVLTRFLRELITNGQNNQIKPCQVVL